MAFINNSRNPILAVAVVLIASTAMFGQCAGIREEGRWRILDSKSEPSVIDVKMSGCGDEVLNGQPSGGTTGFTLRVWVKQSNGSFFGRPTVKTHFRTWNGKRWLLGDVPVGGYVDQMWLHQEDRNGQHQLHVFIKHKSLDSKPDSQSEFWYVKG